MKNLILFFLIFSNLTYGQFHYESDLKRDTASFKNSKLITTTQIDSNGVIKNIITIKKYNDQGFLSYELDLDETGKTIESMTILRPDQFTEVEYYTDKNLKGDTIISIYNKDGFRIQEILNWGEENEMDTSIYTYNNQNKLIKEVDQYSFGCYYDTLIYQNNKLATILSYEKQNGRDDSTSFHYNSEGQLTEIKTFSKNGILLSSEKFLSSSKNKPTLIQRNYSYYESDKIKRKRITTLEYFQNGQPKNEHKKEYNDGNLVWESITIYSKKGFIKELKQNDFVKKIKKTSVTILQKDEKK